MCDRNKPLGQREAVDTDVCSFSCAGPIMLSDDSENVLSMKDSGDQHRTLWGLWLRFGPALLRQSSISSNFDLKVPWSYQTMLMFVLMYSDLECCGIENAGVHFCPTCWPACIFCFV